MRGKTVAPGPTYAARSASLFCCCDSWLGAPNQRSPSGEPSARMIGVVGRAGVENEADVALPDASASARHAVVQGDPSTGQAFVEDAGSRNGTFINEQKLDKGNQRQLHDNDRLRLGSITLVVKLLAAT